MAPGLTVPVHRLKEYEIVSVGKFQRLRREIIEPSASALGELKQESSPARAAQEISGQTCLRES
jgi:hypothetical protein